MESIVLIFGQKNESADSNLVDYFEFHFERMGHSTIWINSDYAFIYKMDPLKMRIPLIILLDPTLSNLQKECLTYVTNQFLTSEFVSGTPENIADKIPLFYQSSYLCNSSLMPLEVSQTSKYIYARLHDPNLTLEEIVNASFFNRTQLEAEYKKYFGATIWQYVIKLRIKEAQRLLIETQKNINEICFAVGIYDNSVFTKCFKKQVGQNPKVFRAQKTTKKTELQNRLS
jgi:YesN/AraC family two-component response regulator